MLAWIAAFLFAFAALSDAEGFASSSSLMSWPVLACAAAALLALDQAARRRDVGGKTENGNDEKGEPG